MSTRIQGAYILRRPDRGGREGSHPLRANEILSSHYKEEDEEARYKKEEETFLSPAPHPGSKKTKKIRERGVVGWQGFTSKGVGGLGRACTTLWRIFGCARTAVRARIIISGRQNPRLSRCETRSAGRGEVSVELQLPKDSARKDHHDFSPKKRLLRQETEAVNRGDNDSRKLDGPRPTPGARAGGYASRALIAGWHMCVCETRIKKKDWRVDLHLPGSFAARLANTSPQIKEGNLQTSPASRGPSAGPGSKQRPPAPAPPWLLSSPVVLAMRWAWWRQRNLFGLSPPGFCPERVAGASRRTLACARRSALSAHLSLARICYSPPRLKEGSSSGERLGLLWIRILVTIQPPVYSSDVKKKKNRDLSNPRAREKEPVGSCNGLGRRSTPTDGN